MRLDGTEMENQFWWSAKSAALTFWPTEKKASGDIRILA
jgi:hypothetical protein